MNIELLLENNETLLLRYAMGFLRDENEAQDMVQEAFLKLIKEQRKVRNARSWLFTTTRNLCLDTLRRRKVREAESFDESFSGGDSRHAPDRIVSGNEKIFNLRMCIELLAPRTKKIVQLKCEEYRSYREIGAIMELTVGNVGFILHKGMQSLRECMEQVS